MRTILRIAPLLLPLALAACAHNTRKECEKTDYYELGLDDGQHGRGRDHLTEAKDRCGPENVPVAEDKYQYGYKVGLAEFCDEDRGKNDAENVQPTNVCMAEKVPPYTAAYNGKLEEVRQQKEKELAKVVEEQKKLRGEQISLQNDVNKIDTQKAADDQSKF